MKKRTVKKGPLVPNLWSIVIGILVIYFGSYLLINVSNLSISWLSTVMPHFLLTKDADLTQLTREALDSLLIFNVYAGLILGIFILLNCLLFAFVGWLVLRTAQTKSLWLAIVPLSIMLTYNALPEIFGLKGFFSMPLYVFVLHIHPILIPLYFIASFLGGAIEKHIRLRYKK